jgi:hypothetical protein
MSALHGAGSGPSICFDIHIVRSYSPLKRKQCSLNTEVEANLTAGFPELSSVGTGCL